MSLWAGWHRDQTSEQGTMWNEPPDLSREIAIRPARKNGLDIESDQPVQSLAGLTGALHDPRQGR